MYNLPFLRLDLVYVLLAMLMLRSTCLCAPFGILMLRSTCICAPCHAYAL